MAKALRAAIIGVGGIGRTHAQGYVNSDQTELVAMADLNSTVAATVAKSFGVTDVYTDRRKMLARDDIDMVSVCVPNVYHAPLVIDALRAGKHVLCEKPITMNHAEAMAVVEAAIRHDVFLMEAFMYRCHPQTARLIELIRARAIGDVRVIQATFSFGAAFDAESRIFKNDLGGGGILDVGCYTTSLARLIAGTATGRGVREGVI